jgi:hypothetical protein
MVESNLPMLNCEALRERKEQLVSVDQAAAYVLDKHATTIEDVRGMRTEVKKWRKIFEAIYKPIRHNFAHKKTADIEEINALLAKANIDEMKAMLGFLHSLHEGLRELYLNGRNPLPLPGVSWCSAVCGCCRRRRAFQEMRIATSVHDRQWIGVPKCSLGQLALRINTP